MGRKKLEQAGPPGSVGRLRLELATADRFIAMVTWGCTAGMVLWSMLNATPYVQAHIDKSWKDTAFVLPLVVDLAFVGALRADEIASRYGVKGGPWAVALRLFTGAASVFLNIGNAWQHHDGTGVGQHLIAPGILVLLAEAGPVYRRKLAARLTEAEAEKETKAEAERARQAEEAEQRRLQEQEDADRQAERDRIEADRLRAQRHEDAIRALDLEEKREQARASRALEARRLDLEERKLTAALLPAPPAAAQHSHGAPQPAPAAPVRVPVAPVVSAPRTAPQSPQAPTGADSSPAVAPMADPRATAADSAAHGPHRAPKDVVASVAAAPPAPARITARVEDVEDQEHELPAADRPLIPARPQLPAALPKDWELPDLPADCAPGRAPELLTDAQARARMDYGLSRGWTQRRIGEFAGRSATTVNKYKARVESAA